MTVLKNSNCGEANGAFLLQEYPGWLQRRKVYALLVRLRLSGRVKRCEEGATLIETALALMLFLPLLIGIMTGCMALYVYHYTAEAAREATRYAIVRGEFCTGFPVCVDSTINGNIWHGAVGTDVQGYVQNLGYPFSKDMQVTTTWWEASVDPTTGVTSWSIECDPGDACVNSATGATLPPGNLPGNLVKVQVDYYYDWVVPFEALRHLHLTSTAEMVVSQ